jgi:hypothetical protein
MAGFAAFSRERSLSLSLGDRHIGPWRTSHRVKTASLTLGNGGFTTFTRKESLAPLAEGHGTCTRERDGKPQSAYDVGRAQRVIHSGERSEPPFPRERRERGRSARATRTRHSAALPRR